MLGIKAPRGAPAHPKCEGFHGKNEARRLGKHVDEECMVALASLVLGRTAMICYAATPW